MEDLTRDAIFKVNDLKVEKLEIKEWGGSIFIRVLSGEERDKFEEEAYHAKGGINYKDFRARFAVQVACDKERKRLFTDGDVKALSRKSSVPLDKIMSAGMRLNGMTQQDVEDIVKNSETGQSDASGSN